MLNSRWDNDPAGYDRARRSWLNKKRDVLALNFLSSAKSGEKVLELGCGTGAMLLHLARRHESVQFYGLEPLANYVEYFNAVLAQEQCGNVTVFNTTAENLITLLPGGTFFTHVISTDVVHHLQDIEETIKQVTKCAAQGCKWLVMEPSWLNPYIYLFQALTKGERNFRPRQFKKLMLRNGWHLTSTQYANLIPSFIPEPWGILKSLESALEWLPVISGRICLTFALEKASR